uniref:Rab_C99 protein n=1 Tax=Paramecium tetraurelia TaxID=5888 RepID=Q3SDV5_PARTE|nr:rab_C99 [Paramecium tetraurelia]
MENQHQFIVLLLGDCNTGKSTIVGRYLENKLVDPQPTVGVVKRETQIDIGNGNQKAQIYDTSGSEKFRAQVLGEFKNASAVVLVYDITDYQSFQNVQTLQKEVIRQNPNVDYWIVVGNKLDLKEQRKVHIDEGKKFASQIGARYIECSAQQPSNINLIFLTIQQWTQINIQPKYVPEQTQRLLEKLNNDEQQKQLQTSSSKNNQTKFKNKNTSFSLIQNNTNNVVSSSFDDQQSSFNGDSMQDYFAQLLKKTDMQTQKVNQ